MTTYPQIPSERARVAHLLRRAAFGYSPKELEHFTKLGVERTVDALLQDDPSHDPVDVVIANLNLPLHELGSLQRWWLLRMLYSRKPLVERMVLFWHSVFTTNAHKVELPRRDGNAPAAPNLILEQNEFFRTHGMGHYPALLEGMIRDPALLIYLDNADNTHTRPNENFAREFLELFTLGVTDSSGTPNYEEYDVQELARVLTGWGVSQDRRFSFDPSKHDHGFKIFLGQSGFLNGDDVVRILIDHPAATSHLCRSLLTYFCHPNPSIDDIRELAVVYQDSEGNIRSVLRSLLLSPVFYSLRSYRSKLRSPVEYVVAVCKALGIRTDGWSLPATTTFSGQALFVPPNVAGWPGGANWMSTTNWLERMNHLNWLITNRQSDHVSEVDFRELLAGATPEKLQSLDGIVDYLASQFVDGQLSLEARRSLVEYLRVGDLWPRTQRLSDLSSSHPFFDRKLRGLLYLFLAMPEFHLA